MIAGKFRRPPDVVIVVDGDPYLRRWHLIPRNRWFNLYLHHFLRSDDDRALHDHPWWNVSILLRGRYIEHLPGDRKKRRLRFVPIVRGARAAHRIALLQDGRGLELPVWTLFITGRYVREWGFWCPQGWRHWRDFTAPGGKTVGRGCE